MKQSTNSQRNAASTFSKRRHRNQLNQHKNTTDNYTNQSTRIIITTTQCTETFTSSRSDQIPVLTSILIHLNHSDSWRLCSFVSDTMSPTQRHWHTDTDPGTIAWPISSSNHQTIISPQGVPLPDKVQCPITGKLVESLQSFSFKKGGTLSPQIPPGGGGAGSRKVITVSGCTTYTKYL